MLKKKKTSFIDFFLFLKIFLGQSQDGGVGRHRVRVSPQLGCLPDAGGEPQHPRRWEEPPSKPVRCGGTEEGREVEAEQDQHPWGVAERGEGFPRLEGPSGAQIRERFPCPISRVSLPRSQAGSYALRGPSSPRWSWGHRREAREKRRGRKEGPSRTEGAGEGCTPRWGPRASETRGGGTPGPLLFLEPKPHPHPSQGLFQPCGS